MDDGNHVNQVNQPMVIMHPRALVLVQLARS